MNVLFKSMFQQMWPFWIAISPIAAIMLAIDNPGGPVVLLIIAPIVLLGAVLSNSKTYCFMICSGVPRKTINDGNFMMAFALTGWVIIAAIIAAILFAVLSEDFSKCIGYLLAGLITMPACGVISAYRLSKNPDAGISVKETVISLSLTAIVTAILYIISIACYESTPALILIPAAVSILFIVILYKISNRNIEAIDL